MLASGRTNNQIIIAPKNSIYLWPNTNLEYPEMIAEKYNRNDIIFMHIYTFFRYHYHENIRYIVADHSCSLNFGQIYKIMFNNQIYKEIMKTELILDAKEFLKI
jgi:hypothetical protein